MLGYVGPGNTLIRPWKFGSLLYGSTFETRLDMRSCYVTQRPGIAIKSQYLKFTFKGERSTLGTWRAIIYRKKGLVHFLAKKSWMILEIYVDQVFWLLTILFYKKWLRTIKKTIYMDNSTMYYMSKYTKKFCAKMRFLYIIWLA